MEVSSIESIIIPRYEKKETKKGWCHYMFGHLIPTKKSINMYLTQFILLAYFCVFLYGLLYKNVFPGSQVFAILIMAFIASIGGKIVGLMRVPPLVGMMIVGFLFRNLDFIPYYNDISREVIGALKLVSLSYILLRGGLGVNPRSLNKIKYVVIRLVLVPLIAEACCICVLSHYLLDLPWIFAIMLGFIISAISQEVVLPLVLYLQNHGYGVEKGITTLLIAATSIDDMVAIAGFTMFFSIAFSTSDLVWTIIKGPLEPLVGFAFGVVVGVLFWHFPSRDRKLFDVIFYNVLLISFAAFSNIFICERLGIPSAGPLGCITVSFVSSIEWRKNKKQFVTIEEITCILWEIIEPVLFVLIGAEITVITLRDTAGFGILTLLLGLIFRSLITILVCSGAGFNLKEKIFVCCGWLPKASVQAAIGSYAMEYARSNFLDQKLIGYGTVVLNMSILSILLTAPLGGVLIRALGPILLTKDAPLITPTDDTEESSSAKRSDEQAHKSYGSMDGSSFTDSSESSRRVTL